MVWCPVDSIEFRCLKPKTGSGTVVDDTPEHLPDIGLFELHDVILGPLEVVPLKGNKFNVPQYAELEEHIIMSKNLNGEITILD